MNYYGNETLLFAEQVKKQCARVTPDIKINFAFRKINTLKSIFLLLQKGEDQNRADSKIIYKIQCENCDSVYIGETARDKQTRIKEHQNNLKKMDHNSKIFQHVYKNSHSMNFNDVKILSYESDWKRRIIKESIFTQELSDKAFNDTKHVIKVF